MSKFRKKGAKGEEAAKKTHSSPMQKKDWAKGMSLEEATGHVSVHLAKGATWSGDDLVYLNAVWDACSAVARELGYIDGE